MAYQNVGIPRFYVSILQWLKSLGMASYDGGDDWTPSSDASSLLDINPSSTITFTAGNNNTGNGDNISYGTNIPLGTIMPTKKNFFMALGHNFNSATVPGLVVRDNGGTEVCKEEVVNNIDGNVYNGFTIMKGDDATDIDDNYLIFSLYGASNAYASDIRIGSLLYGTYFDMPHSPDLSLTMTREYGGIKTIQTKGGASLSNDFGSKPPMWGDAGAWELWHPDTGVANQTLSRSGRRVWDLSFSYLDNHNLWGSNQSLSLSRFDTDDGITDNDDTGEQGTTGNYSFNLLTDDNFYSQVIHKTNGLQLPFIFQPDNTDANIQNFAICKFDSGFKFEQVSMNTYNCKIRIKEIW